MQEQNLYLALRCMKYERSTLSQVLNICGWFQRCFIPNKECLVVLEAVIYGIFGGLEKRRCSALEMILIWIQVVSGPLNIHSLCQQHSSFLSFLITFLFFLQVSRQKSSLRKLSPDLGQASLLPVHSKSFIFLKHFNLSKIFYQFTFDCTRSLLLCASFLQLWQVGATLQLWWAGSQCGGFSCGAWALGHVGFSSCHLWTQQLWLMGLVALWHTEFPQARGRTQDPCIGRQILDHQTTRKVLNLLDLFCAKGI